MSVLGVGMKEWLDGAPYDAVLSGRISGDVRCREKFAVLYVRTREELRRRLGREARVFNPAVLPEGQTYGWYMEVCLAAILRSPGCVLVQTDDWGGSPGAMCEYAAACCLGREVAGDRQERNVK